MGTGTGERFNGEWFLLPQDSALDDADVDSFYSESPSSDWILYDFAEDVTDDLTGFIATDLGSGV
jgi:hypothetical protein